MRIDTTGGALVERLVLEVSLKPFYRPGAGPFAETAREIMATWRDLAGLAERLAVLLWVGDGSEILEWNGDPEAPIKWAHTIGFNNMRHGVYPGTKWRGPQMAREWLDPVPEVRYRDLAAIIGALRDAARDTVGMEIEIGATIDPGPEFVENPWRYEAHPELLRGGPGKEAINSVAFLCSYARLKADPTPRAGYPDGVPDGTPLGRVLGRQFRLFAEAMGIDYLWLSNGFGVTHSAWSEGGEVFDGERFGAEKAAEEKRRLLSFWEEFRAECPDAPVELRGTNFGVGMDIASSAVPLRQIMEQGRTALPPNIPGIGFGPLARAVAGYLSRIAGAPPCGIPFRYYIQDPWFWSDPWWTLYAREAASLYVPLSCAGIGPDGKIRTPSALELLTIDDEEGGLDPDLAREVTPHLARGFATRPDAAGPLVWVYPFGDYHDLIEGRPEALDRAFFGDWFATACVEAGLPLNTVVAAEHVPSLLEQDAEALAGRVLFAPVPLEGWGWAGALCEWVRDGGAALLYGPIAGADPAVKQLLNLAEADPLDGELEVDERIAGDLFERRAAHRLLHHPTVSAGGVRAGLADRKDAETRPMVTVESGPAERVYALARQRPEWNGGRVAWLRGSLTADRHRVRTRPPDPLELCDPADWARHLLAGLGWEIRQERPDASIRPAMLTVARYRGAFMLSGFKPDAPVAVRLRFPDGAPLVTGRETCVEDGASRYCFEKTIRHEARVFVRQPGRSYVRVSEENAPTGRRRRLTVRGLEGATVTVYPEPGSLEDGTFEAVVTGRYDELEPTAEEPWGPIRPLRLSWEADAGGRAAVLRDVSGSITVTW